jgi:hypothetical protein
MKNRIAILATAIALFLSAGAQAGTIYTYQTTGIIDSKAVKGTATFDVGTTGLKITLENTTASVTDIAQILDGFLWTMDVSPALTAAGLTLNGYAVDCNQDTKPCNAASIEAGAWSMGVQPNPYGVRSGPKYRLPGDGLINASYVAPGGKGGLSNDQHQPMLIGTLDLLFNYSGTLTTAPVITGATFVWGTADSGNTTPGCLTAPGAAGCTPSVPEPASMILLGTGLLGAGFFRRKKR